MDLLEQPIGKIARDIPGATSVFHKYGLDFCCGGSKKLSVMIEDKGANASLLVFDLQKLIDLGEPSLSWNVAPLSDLVAYIKDRYHSIYREQLPELIRLSARVEKVHADHPACPTGLTEHLEKMYEELGLHMLDEEKNLFPLIMAGEISKARPIIEQLVDEHENYGRQLEAIEEITHNISAPEGACNTWSALYLGLRTFKVDLMQHIHLENNILFDRIKTEGF
ncbi:MAG: iron-sulfur cluster repair di-iron protein [Alphaproteobacteria bacterium 43-37]|nr:MAG: iron-sulfur cluster repair di-iron protein [Alphaproteobacteria bacterium 43-37]